MPILAYKIRMFHDMYFVYKSIVTPIDKKIKIC